MVSEHLAWLGRTDRSPSLMPWSDLHLRCARRRAAVRSGDAHEPGAALGHAESDGHGPGDIEVGYTSIASGIKTVAEGAYVRRRGPRGPTKFKGSVLTRAQTCLNVGTSYRKVASWLVSTRRRSATRSQRGGCSGRSRRGRPASSRTKPRARHASVVTRMPRAAWRRRGKRKRPRADGAAGQKRRRSSSRRSRCQGGRAGGAARPATGPRRGGAAALRQSEARILRLDLDAELRPDGPVRIKSPEGLTTHAPGEFGRVWAWTARRK